MSAKRAYERAWQRAGELGVRSQLAELVTAAVETLELAEADYAEIRWGQAPDAVVVLEAPAVMPGQTLTELGVLELIEYSGSKGGGREYVWSHPFEPSKPLLCVNSEARLVIVGGDYTVTERGIVG